MSGNQRKRLERLEEKYADLARQESLANCICQAHTVAYSTTTFEAEMNESCPAHGFRRLGQIMIVHIVPTRKDRADSVDERSLGLEELVEEYERRLAEVEQAEDEQEYGSQEP